MESRVISPAFLFCIFLTAFTQFELLHSENNSSTKTFTAKLKESSSHSALAEKLVWGTIEVKKTEAGFNIIQWVTIKELNVKEFLVQRSDNGKNFFAFRRLDAKGDKYEPFKYQVTDHKAKGKFFYRIIAIDSEGKATYSKTINE
jgi:hypothetical protein